MDREYTEKVSLTLNQLRNLERAQRHIYDSGIVKPDTNLLISLLSPISGILGLICAASTPASLAAGVVSLITGLTPSARENLKNMVFNGYWNFGYLEDYMVKNPQYTAIQVNFPFIEKNANGSKIRFVIGKGLITGVKTSAGWAYSS